ncbi:hypothetical protein EC845_1177 [Comamonas sp. BIGb0124]|nr:hypothetical protein EC845_1177 [Comamonas sp. BIGb0124]
MLWYSDMVGCMVPFEGIWAEAYHSREPAGFTNIVHFGDAVPALYTRTGKVIPLSSQVNKKSARPA